MQMQEQMQRIESYVKAQHFASILNAHSCIKTAMYRYGFSSDKVVSRRMLPFPRCQEQE